MKLKLFLIFIFACISACSNKLPPEKTVQIIPTNYEEVAKPSYAHLKQKIIPLKDFQRIKFKQIKFGNFGDTEYGNATNFFSSCNGVAPAYRLIGIEETGGEIHAIRKVTIDDFSRKEHERGVCVSISLNGRSALIKNVK